VVAYNDDLIGDGSIDDANDIPVGCDDIVLLVVQIDNDAFRRRTDAVVHPLVPKAQVCLPVFVEVSSRWAVAVESLENRQCILVRDRNARDARDIRLSGATRDAGFRRITGSGWVTRCDAQELGASALHTAGLTRRALGVLLHAFLFSNFSIVTRVGIEDHTDGTQLLGPFHLEAPEDTAIPCDGDLALQVDASLDESGVAVESWDTRVEAGGGVFLEDVLYE